MGVGCSLGEWFPCLVFAKVRWSSLQHRQEAGDWLHSCKHGWYSVEAWKRDVSVLLDRRNWWSCGWSKSAFLTCPPIWRKEEIAADREAAFVSSPLFNSFSSGACRESVTSDPVNAGGRCRWSFVLLSSDGRLFFHFVWSSSTRPYFSGIIKNQHRLLLVHVSPSPHRGRCRYLGASPVLQWETPLTPQPRLWYNYYCSVLWLVFNGLLSFLKSHIFRRSKRRTTREVLCFFLWLNGFINPNKHPSSVHRHSPH